MHRSLTGGAAGHWRFVAQAASGLTEHRTGIGIYDRLYREYLRVIAKGLHGPIDHRLAADYSILLGATCAGAESASGCDKDGGSAVSFRHLAQ